MPPGGFRTHNLSRRTAADLHHRLRGHWGRRCVLYYIIIVVVVVAFTPEVENMASDRVF